MAPERLRRVLCTSNNSTTAQVRAGQRVLWKAIEYANDVEIEQARIFDEIQYLSSPVTLRAAGITGQSPAQQSFSVIHCYLDLPYGPPLQFTTLPVCKIAPHFTLPRSYRLWCEIFLLATSQPTCVF